LVNVEDFYRFDIERRTGGCARDLEQLLTQLFRRTRRIEVVTKRDGVKVWSRTSYSLRPTPQETAKK